MIRLTIVLICLFAAWPAAASAGFITTVTATVTPLPNGLYEYEYTVANDASSDLNVDGFVIDVSEAASLSALAAPPDWEIVYQPGDISVGFGTSLDPILPGASGIFAFQSHYAPGSQPYLVTGINEEAEDSDRNFGEISSPTSPAAAVPSPSAAVLAVMGSTALMVLRRPRWRDCR